MGAIFQPHGRRKPGFRGVCAALHRDLGYFFAGVVLIYAISGIAMNHRNSFNPNYSVENVAFALPHEVAVAYDAVDAADIDAVFSAAGCPRSQYTKHFRAADGRLKILIKGGSSITVDLSGRKAEYEKITPRVVLGPMVRLHYNPGRWWSVFSDAFAVSLILITISGLFVLKGKNGMKRRGAILVAAGLVAPLLFLCL